MYDANCVVNHLDLWRRYNGAGTVILTLNVDLVDSVIVLLVRHVCCVRVLQGICLLKVKGG